jgi:hypothetical protein
VAKKKARTEVEAIMAGRSAVDLRWLGQEDVAFDKCPLLLIHS